MFACVFTVGVVPAVIDHSTRMSSYRLVVLSMRVHSPPCRNVELLTSELIDVNAIETGNAPAGLYDSACCSCYGVC
jgi:hypothetical protein